MITMGAYKMASRTVKKHKGVDISCLRPEMAVVDLIYPETKGHINYNETKRNKYALLITFC